MTSLSELQKRRRESWADADPYRTLARKDKYAEVVNFSAMNSFFVHDFIRHIEFDTVLNVGCGLGPQNTLFGLMEKDVVGVDINKKFIEAARSESRGEFVVGDAENLPFDDNSFDMVFTFKVVQHIPICKGVLSEFSRVSSEHIVMMEQNIWPSAFHHPYGGCFGCSPEEYERLIDGSELVHVEREDDNKFNRMHFKV